MRLDKLWLTDFRSYESAELPLAPGLTAILGPNGRGKTNLLEAVGWLATLSSFRGAPNDVLVRAGAASAVLRCEGTVERDAEGAAGRSVLIEAEIVGGRSRVLVNKQRLARARDLLGHVRATVFAPEDLELVKGGLGVSIAPRWTVAEEVSAGEVTAVALTPRGIFRHWHAATLAAAPQPLYLREFVELLVALPVPVGRTAAERSLVRRALLKPVRAVSRR